MTERRKPSRKKHEPATREPVRLRAGAPSPLHALLATETIPPFSPEAAARIEASLRQLSGPELPLPDALPPPPVTPLLGGLGAKIAVGAFALVAAGGALIYGYSRPPQTHDSAPILAPSLPASVEITQPPPSANVEPLPPVRAPKAEEKRRPEDVPSVDGELALLREAHAALARDPASAIAPLRKHASRYPNGALRPEREFLLADAFARAGRVAEARQQIARAKPILEGTPYRARLDALEARLGTSSE